MPTYGILYFSLISTVQMDTTVLANNSQHCGMLHVVSICTPCCMLLRVVGVWNWWNCLSQQLPTFLLFWKFLFLFQSTAQQCWIYLHSSFNIVRATQAHYTWSPKSNVSWNVAGSQVARKPEALYRLYSWYPRYRYHCTHFRIPGIKATSHSISGADKW